MTPFIRICLFCLILAPLSVRGEIFADFTVTHGGSPIGTFRVQLFHEQAPRAVANFVGLASGQRPWLNLATNRLETNTPFYDGLTFHRLIHHFMIQGGDPQGNGSGGPGYVFQDQFDPALRHDSPYLLSMANSGFNTNGSQFFITLASATHLDDKHTIFGEVISGRDVIDEFMDPDLYPTDANDRPLDAVVMQSVTLSGSGLAGFLETLEDHGLPLWKPVPARISWTPGDEETVPALLVHFARQDRWDYPIIWGDDLFTWPSRNFGISLGENLDQTINFTPEGGTLNDAPRGFFKVYGLDYQPQPDPPRSLFIPGTVVEFAFSHGLLSITFGSNAASSAWTYTPETGDPSSGFLTHALDLSSPAEGFFLNTSGSSHARHLLLRTVRLYFDGPVFSGGWSDMEPTLSFHSDESGWFRELSFDGGAPLAGIEGTFTVTLP